MYVYRSEDGGTTWGDAIRAGRGDYERLGADHTTGRYAGRLYLAAESNCKAPDVERCSEVRLWRSEDDGRTWIGPVITGRSLGAAQVAIGTPMRLDVAADPGSDRRAAGLPGCAAAGPVAAARPWGIDAIATHSSPIET